MICAMRSRRSQPLEDLPRHSAPPLPVDAHAWTGKAPEVLAYHTVQRSCWVLKPLSGFHSTTATFTD
jgi:hypothetical protein